MRWWSGWFLLGIVAIGCGGSAKRSQNEPGSGGFTAGSPSVGGSAGGGGSGTPSSGGTPQGVGGASSSGGSQIAGNGGIPAPAGGTAGLAGAAGDGGARALIECASHADCTVLGDCCGCRAVPVGTVSQCSLDCEADRCEDFNDLFYPDSRDAFCIFGQCVLEVDCYFPPLQPICGSEPECLPGQVPSSFMGCYHGCIDATECRSVSGCDSCTAPDQVCVFEQGAVGVAHCSPRPAGCSDGALCDCMSDVCGQILPCTEGENGIACGNG